MRVIDCSEKQVGDIIPFDRETIMVMCFTPKIIVFETSEKLNKFKRVWEDIIAEYLEKNEEELDPNWILQEYATWFVDQFEEESWLMRKFEDGDEDTPKGRKGKVIILSEEEALEKYEWEDKTVTHLGMLNSKDTWTGMDVLEEQCKLIRMMFDKEELNSRLKDDTKEMFKIILRVWEEDVELSKKEDRKYFYAYVDID